MALIETSLIWVAYAVCLGILFFISAIFVFVYQKPTERAISVTIVAWLTILALLATVLLMPVDIALVSATNSRKLGRKKDWATPDRVDETLHTLKIVYYTLYSLDAVLCLLVVPFTYFWYEEYDEVASEEGQQSIGSRLVGALKYTIGFLLLCVILFLVGFFIPVTRSARKDHKDLGYFKDIILENHGERALTFAIGLLMLVGTLLYCLYTAPGLALLPLTLIKSAPRISAPQLAATSASQLEQNRERQRQLEGRSEGREGGLDPRDRRELESLVREERTLVRRERLATESTGEGRNLAIRIWLKLEAFFRPLKLIFGLLIAALTLVLFASMLITMVDKLKNSPCGAKCGYILGRTHIVQPINALLTLTSRIFPIDYILYLLLVLLFFTSSIVGLTTLGIRFLWIKLFTLRSGHTSPNALLITTVLLTTLVLALNYSLPMILAPQYATYGPQTFCDRPLGSGADTPDCTHHHSAIKPCSLGTDNPLAHLVCTPSVASTFLNRLTANFPWMGVVLFYAQFAFLGIFAIVFGVMLFRVPHLGEEQLDADLREEEEEGLLASTGRRFGASWQDVTGRVKGVRRYGATEEQGEGVNGVDGAAEER